jgi:quinoprotein glucose dehydrogenase
MTGKPLFPVEHRKVPPSSVDGERLADTQPFPLAPPPFTRRGPTEAMLTQRTRAAHEAVLAEFRKLKAGLFTPPSLEGTIEFPGVDGGAEWGGAAFDPDAGLLYVNANEMPWIVRLIPNTDTSLYNAKCATCHREDRQGSPAAPSLVDVAQRRTREQIADIIRHGTGRMPGFPDLGAKNTNDLVEFLTTGRDRGKDPEVTKDPSWLKYRSDGETLWRDPDGYPPLTPPWGTLTALDLNAGTIKWQIPFGEFPELAARGMTNTGSDNYGGPVVTASGLVFIGATNFDRKFHAYDKETGRLLWETTLPAAGNATPAIYQIDGREYIVIACGGGKNGAPSGSAIVAFALPAQEKP